MKRPADIRRLIELRVLPALIAVAIGLPLSLAGDLPDPLATRWTFDGEPSATMPRTLLWVTTIVIWLIAWTMLERRLHRPDIRAGVRMPVAVALLSVGGTLAAAMIVITAANDHAASWRDARVDGALPLLAVVAGACLTGGVGWWCERGRPAAPRADPHVRPTVRLGPTEKAVWFGRGRSDAALATGAAIIAASLLALLLALSQPAIAIALLPLLPPAIITAAALIWASEVKVVVTATGVLMKLGPFGSPSNGVALHEIADADAIDVDPWAWGGWGYRRGRRVVAWVSRRGPGLRLRLHDGRTLVMTVDHPDDAAGLIDDLLARTRYAS